jgi:hypothetical protein
MKLTEMQKRFEHVALIRGSVFLLAPTDALRFIDECERSDVDILGVEGFKVFGDKIQPCQEHSFDLYGESTNSHAIATAFIEQRINCNLWFEVGTAENES